MDAEHEESGPMSDPRANSPSGKPSRNGRPRQSSADMAQRGRPPSQEELAALLKMISQSSDARDELVADVRNQIDAGSYLTEEKLNLAIYRLLKDILS